MKFEIKNCFSGELIFSIETDTWKLAVEAAIKAKADLSSADLRSANLRSADLRSANLRYANLSSANLRSANLSSANLSSANLRSANLSSANLSSADLRSANLRSANLRSADLSSANLSSADLRSALGFTAYQATPLKMLEFQTGPIRLFKLVNAKGIGPFNGGITYEVGEGYECPEANCNEQEQCAAGLNVATLDWCLLHLEQGYRIFVVEFQAKDIAAIPIATDGKIRVKKLKVVEELDLSKYLPKKEEKAVSA